MFRKKVRKMHTKLKVMAVVGEPGIGDGQGQFKTEIFQGSPPPPTEQFHVTSVKCVILKNILKDQSWGQFT